MSSFDIKLASMSDVNKALKGGHELIEPTFLGLVCFITKDIVPKCEICSWIGLDRNY